MIILVTAGAMLALAFGLAIANDMRGRRSRRPRVQAGQIDATEAESLIVAPSDFFGKFGGEYLPPPDDGRPRH